MSYSQGSANTLRELLDDPRICKDCKKIILSKLKPLEAKEAAWHRNTMYHEQRIPA